MLIYDGSNRDQCEVQRPNTSSPLQVLVMMNDPQILEASGYFAQRLLKDTKTPKQNIEKAFQTILCRPVKSDELSLLENYFDEVQNEMTEEKAHKLLAVGEMELETKEPIRTATLMQTIQLIYNLEESSMK
jgi:hypothetical protein